MQERGTHTPYLQYNFIVIESKESKAKTKPAQIKIMMREHKSMSCNAKTCKATKSKI